MWPSYFTGVDQTIKKNNYVFKNDIIHINITDDISFENIHYCI